MSLETGTFISDLNIANPIGSTDFISQGDDHIRLIKKTLKNTFPNITGAIDYSSDELNTLNTNINYSIANPDIGYEFSDINVNGNQIVNITSVDLDTACQPRLYYDTRYHLIQSTLNNGLILKNNAPIVSFSVDLTNYNLAVLDNTNKMKYGDATNRQNIDFIGSNINLSTTLYNQCLVVKNSVSKNILGWVYPIGAIYENYISSKNPSELMLWSESEWESFGDGRVLISVGEGTDDYGSRTFAIDEEDGEFKHKLTKDELHTHAHQYAYRPAEANGAHEGDEIINGMDTGGYIQLDTGDAGEDIPHNNIQRYNVVYRWRRIV